MIRFYQFLLNYLKKNKIDKKLANSNVYKTSFLNPFQVHGFQQKLTLVSV